MANGEWRMANGEWRMAICDLRIANGESANTHHALRAEYRVLQRLDLFFGLFQADAVQQQDDVE